MAVAMFTKWRFWVLLFLAAWMVLVIVQISLGMGGAPGGGGAP
ncbi:hypothetical protein [Kibdelosporangium aridum]